MERALGRKEGTPRGQAGGRGGVCEAFVLRRVGVCVGSGPDPEQPSRQGRATHTGNSQRKEVAEQGVWRELSGRPRKDLVLLWVRMVPPQGLSRGGR